VDVWIGAGGWGYFRGPTGNSLGDYARGFRFVEVNSTFYRHPPPLSVRRWRRSVPADFHFAVKGHRSITHTARFRAANAAMASIAKDAAIVRALASDILVLETPPAVQFGPPETAALKEFAAALGGGIRIALEARAYDGKPLPKALASTLFDVGGIDVVDLSKGVTPRVESDVMYTRLFGQGDHNVWEFSDNELRDIDASATSTGSNRMVFAFHGVRMYKDAARFVEFRSTGSFSPATRGQGTVALTEVLAPDVRFPATRAQLLRDHGWKVIAAGGGRNVHASELLARLPERTFRSLPETLDALAVPAPGAQPPASTNL